MISWKLYNFASTLKVSCNPLVLIYIQNNTDHNEIDKAEVNIEKSLPEAATYSTVTENISSATVTTPITTSSIRKIKKRKLINDPVCYIICFVLHACLYVTF